jgi:hypothetical protein
VYILYGDLVNLGIAKVGETLGFSVGLNKSGRIAINNMSELNRHLGLGGELPNEVIQAIREALQ